MNAWYFTFEFPPEFGGGLSTYMSNIRDGYLERPQDHLVVFTLSYSQSGLITTRHLAENILLVTLNPERTGQASAVGHWTNISVMFERMSDLLMMQIDTGALSLPRPDYIEFADGFGIGAMTVQQKLCLNSRFADVVVVITAHTPTFIIDRLNQVPIYTLPNYHTAQLELQALAGADVVISPSQAVLDVINKDLKAKGSTLPETVVLPNPYIPKADVHPPRTDLVHDHFYMASRLTHWKGVESAIKAMEQLWLKGVEVPFHIYGEDTIYNVSGGSYANYIRKRYSGYVERGLIRLLGKVPRHLIDLRSQTAYAQIHPSHFDNFPYSLLEAMSNGTICVAGLNGGIREIAQSGKNIFLTDVHDSNVFAKVLESVIALSPGERKRMSRAAVECVRDACSVGTFLDKKELIIRRIARKKRAIDFPFLSPPNKSCVFAAPKAKKGEAELSVVIPYFNMGPFIDETIGSVLKSSIRDKIEIILVNDGSTDHASRIKLDTLHAVHGLNTQQLRILNIPNGGVANARNQGAAAARTSFVALLDADDLIGARYYEKAVRILRQYRNVSFVGAWIEDFNTRGRIRNWLTWNVEPPMHLIFNQTNCQSLVYKRKAFLMSGWHDPDLRMFLDDWEGVIALLAGGHRGVMIPEALFEYRIRPNSIFRSTHNLWDLNYEKITQKHRDLYNRWGADIAAFMNANGPNNFYHIAGKASGLNK